MNNSISCDLSFWAKFALVGVLNGCLNMLEGLLRFLTFICLSCCSSFDWFETSSSTIRLCYSSLLSLICLSRFRCSITSSISLAWSLVKFLCFDSSFNFWKSLFLKLLTLGVDLPVWDFVFTSLSFLLLFLEFYMVFGVFGLSGDFFLEIDLCCSFISNIFW